MIMERILISIYKGNTAPCIHQQCGDEEACGPGELRGARGARHGYLCCGDGTLVCRYDRSSPPGAPLKGRCVTRGEGRGGSFV